jgi:plastocyanin
VFEYFPEGGKVVQRFSSIRGLIQRGMILLFLTASVSGCQLPAFLTRGGSTATGSLTATSLPTKEVPPGTVNVYLQDYGFHPERLTIKAGTTVTWINRDPVFHTVTSDTNVFQSGMLAVGQAYSYTFDQPGTYPYYSKKSGGPGGEGMSGVIIVVA